MDQSTNQNSKYQVHFQSQFAPGMLVKTDVKAFIGVIISTVAAALLSWFPIVNILLWINVVVQVILLIFNVIMTFVILGIHKDMFYTEEGIRYGKTVYDSILIPWDKVEAIDCGKLKAKAKTGTIAIATSIPNEKKPEKTKRYAVTCVKEPHTCARVAAEMKAQYTAESISE